MNKKNLKIVDSLNDDELHRKAALFTEIGQMAVKKVREKNRRLGIPSPFMKDGKIHYELPDGTITDISPFKT